MFGPRCMKCKSDVWESALDPNDPKDKEMLEKGYWLKQECEGCGKITYLG